MAKQRKSAKKFKEAYRLQCKCKYYGILLAYLCDFLVKIYLCYKVGGLAVVFGGIIVDFTAKWYMLRNMKFRKV